MRLVFVAAFLWSAVAASAGIPVTQRMTCPIGGERFNFVTTISYSTFGSRPDGKPYGSWTFPLALPECPGNGLILYKEHFNADERNRLGALLAGEPWRSLRAAGETQYYRLAWLLGQMGEPEGDRIGALTQATWEAAAGSDQRRRYLAELAEAAAAQAGEPSDLPAFIRRGRWINALRELGRFEDAAALLGRTDLPAIERAEGDADLKEGLRGYFSMLRTLVQRRDDSIEPLDFLPLRHAASICLEPEAPLDQRQSAYCATPEMLREVEELRAARSGNRDLAEQVARDAEEGAREMERAAERPQSDPR